MKPLRNLLHIKLEPEKPINGVWRTKLEYDRDQQMQAEVLAIGPKVKYVSPGDTIVFKKKDVYFRDSQDIQLIAESNVLYGVYK